MAAISVLACESQPVVVEGLRDVFRNCVDLRFLGAVPDLTRARPWISRLQPRLVLTDAAAGINEVLQFARDVRRASPESRILLWVAELSETDALRALQAGVRGVVRRRLPVATLLECLRSVAAGEIWLENSLINLLSNLSPVEKEMALRA